MNAATENTAMREMDIDTLMGRLGFARSHLIWIICSGVTCVFTGYMLFLPVYSVHYVVGLWHIDKQQVGMMISAGLFGVFIGSLIHGELADRFGRRPVMLISTCLAGIFCGLSGLMTGSSDFVPFVILRVLTGLMTGAMLPLAYTYVNECLPSKHHSVMVMAPMLGMTVGAVISAAIGEPASSSLGWESVYYFGTLAILLAAVGYFYLLESPRFEVAIGRSAEAVSLSIRRAFPAYWHTADNGNVRYCGVTETSHFRLASLFTADYRRDTLSLWVAQFMIMFELYAVAGWIPNILVSRGFSIKESFLTGIIVQVAGATGTIVMALCADHLFHRRVIAMVAAIVTLVGAVLFGSVSGLLMSFVLTGVLGFGVLGGMYTVSTLAAHTYVTGVRGTGVGMLYGVGHIGGLLGPYVAGVLLAIEASEAAFFYVVAAASFISFVAISLYKPPSRAGYEAAGVAGPV